jgi:hypothetical protein
MREATRLKTALLAAAAATMLATGCGGGDSKKQTASPDALKSATTAPAPTNGPTGAAPTSGAKPHSTGVTLKVPAGWSQPKPPDAPQIWPRALKVAASFPIARVPANAACPRTLLDAMPADGIYVLVAEYTKPRPPGFPAPRKFGPRPDLSKLDVRPSEIECWDGLGGATEFTENGRSFRVQILFGAQVTAAKRQEALDALNTLRFA